MNLQSRLVGAGDVLVFVTSAPLAVAGLIWLALESDLSRVWEHWGMFLLLGGLIILFNRLNYFIIIEIRKDRYGSADGSLVSAILWSGVFLFGVEVLWLAVLAVIVQFGVTWRRSASKSARWSLLRNLAGDLAVLTLAYLVAVACYLGWGGAIPFPDFSPPMMAAALGALGVHFLVVLLIWAGYLGYSIWVQKALTEPPDVLPLLRFMLLALGLPFLALPFSILLAGLYTQAGVGIYFFLIFGLVLVALLARRLSWAVETGRQKTRQLERLEQLGRAILNAPPDASRLAEILREHAPQMFPSGKLAIWLHTGEFLLRHPEDWEPPVEALWEWARGRDAACAFLAKEALPWMSDGDAHSPVVLAPIMSVDQAQPIGCIYLELRSLAQPWDRASLESLFPAMHSLSDQVASALYQARVYQETLEYQAAMQELEFAGRIQASFLPNELPILPGWELSVTLLPARNTSGDYFDFIPFEDGKIGILIADVADKGLGAALYMALSRTLIRTYALEYGLQPDLVFFSTNERILQDARANLFVTSFYGILDVHTGALTYCNAGHSPPFLIRAQDGGRVESLLPTGMPIGVDEDAYWKSAQVHIEPGDVLLLYTDGIPDAQNGEGMPFREARLIEVAQAHRHMSAQEMQTAILEALHEFVGDQPQFDDITLLVVMRDRPA